MMALLAMGLEVAVSGAEIVDVYLIGGQSNATGQGYVRNLREDLVLPKTVRIFHSERIVSGKAAYTWLDLCPASEDPSRFGPELGFGIRLAELEPKSRIGLIKHATSGSGLWNDWNPGMAPGKPCGPDFSLFVQTVERGMQALREEGFDPVIRGMLWLQGERDANGRDGPAPAAAYRQNLQHVIARFREQFKAPDMLFAYVLVLPVPTDHPGRDVVRQAQRDCDQNSAGAAAVPGALLVDGDDGSLRRDDPATPYPRDVVHFGTDGIFQLGQRLADRIHGERLATGDLSGDPALDPAPVIRRPSRRYADAVRMFQGIPGIECAPGGRLWATWYTGGTGEGPENCVVLATSKDKGTTWSPLKLVIDPPGNIRAFDPCLWLDPDGRLWLFYAQSRSWYDGRAGVWAVVTEQPDAEDPSWSRPRRLGHGIMMNKPLVLGSGEWLLPAALWNTGEKNYAELDDYRRANVIVSHDHGTTWHLAGGARIPHGRDCDEHMLMEWKDGTLNMFVRTTYGIGESLSTDRGRSWSDVVPSTTLAHTTSRFFIRRLHSGHWLLVKHGEPGERCPRERLKAFVSADEGKTWEGGLLLDERLGVSYPDGVECSDGTIRIIYDYDRTGAKEILMAAFTEADARVGKEVSGCCRRRVLVNKATGSIP